MNKVVVTGGAGFIGSNLVKKLVEKNFKVIVIDNLYSGKYSNLESVKDNIYFFEKDICDDLSFLNELGQISGIFHLAAIPSVNFSLENPIEVNRVNVEGTINLLEFCKKNNVKTFVYSASSAAYGERQGKNSEQDLPYPISPYGVSKLTGEYYVKAYSTLYDINGICLRYFNVFGPGQSPDSEYAAVIPKFIFSAVNNSELKVFGDGEQTRDFTFVGDIVNANIKAYEKNENIGTINIATGKSVSLNSLIEEISKIKGENLNVKYLPERAGDIKFSQADVNLSFEKIGFKAEYKFAYGIEKTYRWFCA
ncbi:MAG: NAD-dependent epimerase/dehydratase family protein [Candidatus Muirbacterium halophilum]|nr:NAD-dependent epimerase/dehydratase family protein [Candidatus Muirbacterium halophilum]MCK9476938.1 NAD-dependent epimerase/dehydratase family protein [Candidatus Muirbacterium halophilum]